MAAPRAHRRPPRRPDAGGQGRTPLPLLRLRHLLNVVDQHPAVRDQVQGLLAAFWRDIDAAALFADFGFGSRLSLRSDLPAASAAACCRARRRPPTWPSCSSCCSSPRTPNGCEAIDDATLTARVGCWPRPTPPGAAR
jgi:hypothetical protein